MRHKLTLRVQMTKSAIKVRLDFQLQWREFQIVTSSFTTITKYCGVNTALDLQRSTPEELLPEQEKAQSKQSGKASRW